MPTLPKITLALAAAGLMSLGPATPVTAQKLTNDMTCAEAKAQYERTGRVTTRSRGGQILPIYGGVPVKDRFRLSCDPSQRKFNKSVVTSDKRLCVIAVRCI
jgi:hypothetical protein